MNSRGSYSSYTCPSHIQPTCSSTTHCTHRLGLTHFIFTQTVLPTTPLPVCLQYAGLYKITYSPNYPSQRLSHSSGVEIRPLANILLQVGWDLNAVAGCGHCSPHTTLITALLWKQGAEITAAPPNQNINRWAEQHRDHSRAVQKLEGSWYCFG